MFICCRLSRATPDVHLLFHGRIDQDSLAIRKHFSGNPNVERSDSNFATHLQTIHQNFLFHVFLLVGSPITNSIESCLNLTLKHSGIPKIRNMKFENVVAVGKEILETPDHMKAVGFYVLCQMLAQKDPLKINDLFIKDQILITNYFEDTANKKSTDCILTRTV